VISDASWTAYTKAVVDIDPPGRTGLRISPRPKGEVGLWPNWLRAPLFVITAWNPGPNRLEIELNRARQRSLEADLARLGVTVWPAVGWDIDTQHREESVAVSGLSEEDAIELGTLYGQDAIFGWTPTAWHILSCVDESHRELGWLLETPTD
jgi:hypothetical protein